MGEMQRLDACRRERRFPHLDGCLREEKQRRRGSQKQLTSINRDQLRRAGHEESAGAASGCLFGAGCKRWKMPRGGAAGIRFRACCESAARILPDSPPGWGRAIPGSALQSGLASTPRIQVRGCVVREHGKLYIHAAGKLRRRRQWARRAHDIKRSCESGLPGFLARPTSFNEPSACEPHREEVVHHRVKRSQERISGPARQPACRQGTCMAVAARMRREGSASGGSSGSCHGCRQCRRRIFRSRIARDNCHYRALSFSGRRGRSSRNFAGVAPRIADMRRLGTCLSLVQLAK